MYSQSVKSPTMAIDICINVQRNPMDLSSLLNPYLTPPTSDDDEEDEEEMEDDEDDEDNEDNDDEDYDEDENEMAHNLSYVHLQGYSAPQPMEVDGEVTPYQPSSFNNENRLPPIRVLTESDFSLPIAYRPDQHPYRSSESFLESHGRRRSSSYSNSSRRDHHRGFEIRRRLSPTWSRISPSSSVSSSFSSLEARYVTKDGKKRRKKCSTGPHNNRPYTQEQVQWIRYHKEDCGMGGQALYALWLIRFPNDLRHQGQSFSSRTYRDNVIPVTDDNGDLVFDKTGKPLLNKCGVRERNLPKHKDFPFKLVDKHPEWALYWDWVSPEHKEMAQKILDGNLDEAQKRK